MRFSGGMVTPVSAARSMATAGATRSPPGSRRLGTKTAVGLFGVIGSYYAYTYSTLLKNSAQAEAEAPRALSNPNEWVDLRLREVITESPNTKLFRFDLPSGDHVIGLEMASALLTKFKGPNDEKPIIRPYTPVSDEDERGYVDLLVKRYEGGRMSMHLHDELAPGQTLSFKGPIMKYKWEENKHDTIVLIGAGTGITPMYQLIRAVFKNPNDKTKVILIDANITEQDMLLRKTFDDLESKHPNQFKAFYLLEQPSDGYKGATGRISKDILKQLLPAPGSGNTKVFVCGPPGFYKAVSGPKNSPADQGELTGMLAELGYTKDDVYKF